VKRALWGIALGALLVGCGVPKEAGFPDVARAVGERTGYRIVWNRGGAADAEVARRVTALLQKPIGEREAVQIALLRNRRIQGTYEDLMIAQADLVQAGLLHNPVLSGSVRVPLEPGGVPNVELGVEHDFFDLLLIPARQRLAASAFEAAKLRVGGEVMTLAADVRVAYFMLQGAQQVALMRRTIAEAGEASIDLAQRQHDAGNISDLDFAGEQALYEQIRLDLARSQGEILGARERLIRLLGLFGAEVSFTLPATLPSVPAEDPALDHLEALALARRLDIAAAREEVQVSAHQLALASNGRWLVGGVGLSFERDSSGGRVAGPSAHLELPLFDQKQALLARLSAELRQRQERLAALSIDARSEVREARGRVSSTRTVAVHYRTVVIPLRERIVALSQQNYDAMLLGVYQLLIAKQNEVNAYREYIEAVRDYWIARAELSRAIGGDLATAPPAGR
jgi:cobalt-zinc-cadmium efflux system outer membrane protein